MLSSALTRVISLCATVALGLLLTAEDYGVYAYAFGLGALGAALRDAGVPSVLIQRDRLVQDWQSARRLGLISNVAAGLLVAALALLPGQSRELQLVILLIAASFPAGSLAGVYRAAARAQLLMRDLFRINVLAIMFQQSLAVVLAGLGVGAASFALPLLLAPVLETYLLARLVQAPHRGAVSIQHTSMRELFTASRWMLLSALAMTLVQRGDYLVLGTAVTSRVLGLYFFAFQLTVAAGSLVSTAVNTSMLPYLGRNAKGSSGVQGLFYDSARILGVAGGLVFGGLIAVAPTVLLLVWQDRWVDAVLATQLLAAATAFRLINPLTHTLLEALGLWRQRAVLASIEGVLIVIGAYVGSRQGTLLAVVVAVGVARAASGAVCVVWGDRRLNSRVLAGGTLHFLPPVILSVLLGVALAPNTPWHWTPRSPDLTSIALISVTYLTCYVMVMYVLELLVPAYATTRRKLQKRLIQLLPHRSGRVL